MLKKPAEVGCVAVAMNNRHLLINEFRHAAAKKHNLTPAQVSSLLCKLGRFYGYAPNRLTLTGDALSQWVAQKKKTPKWAALTAIRYLIYCGWVPSSSLAILCAAQAIEAANLRIPCHWPVEEMSLLVDEFKKIRASRNNNHKKVSTDERHPGI